MGLWPRAILVMHPFDHLVDAFAGLFRFHSYPPVDKAYAALLFVAGLSLRMSLRGMGSLLPLGSGSIGLDSLFRPERKPRRLVAVDETCLKRCGERVYIWSALDIDSGERIAVYASRGRSILNALAFLRRVLEACEGKPVIVVDRGPWYPWALKRLGIDYFHETFAERNKIERWFRVLKEKTKCFYDNSKTVKSLEELVEAIAPFETLWREILNSLIDCEYKVRKADEKCARKYR